MYYQCLRANSSQHALNRLQRVMNAAARLVHHSGRLTPVSGLLHDRLHWLHVPEWVGYKLYLPVFKAVRDTAPEYPSELCRSNAQDAARSRLLLAAHSDFQVSRSKTNLVIVRLHHRTSVVEQTTSNNPVIWHSSEFQEPTESSLFWWTIFSINFECRRHRIWLPCYSAEEINTLLLLLWQKIWAFSVRSAVICILHLDEMYVVQSRSKLCDWLVEVVKSSDWENSFRCHNARSAMLMYRYRVIRQQIEYLHQYRCGTLWRHLFLQNTVILSCTTSTVVVWIQVLRLWLQTVVVVTAWGSDGREVNEQVCDVGVCWWRSLWQVST